MKARLARLTLGTALALAATAPLSAPAHAAACNDDQFPEVCAAIVVACNATHVTYKVCSSIR